MKVRNTFAAVTLAVTVICALASSSYASLLFSEGFNYTPGSYLTGNGPWTNVPPSANGGMTIGSGQLTYPGLALLPGYELSISNGNAAVSIATFAHQTADQVYYSFLFQVNTLDGGNDYVTALNPNPGTYTAPAGGTDAIDLYSYTQGKFEIRANSDGATGGASPVTASLNTTYLVVEELDMVANQASLWIDPASGSFGGSAPAATAILSNTTATAIDDIGFKSQSVTGLFTVGNVLIGTTWADVTPEAVPEPSTLVLCGLGMLGLVLARRLRR
jgi:hypothetical protein